MIDNTKPLVVIIDDDLPDNYPLPKYLKNAYGNENVFLFKYPAEGVKFIEENLSSRIIVILDIMFDGRAIGLEVFDHLVDKSSLICVIIMTGNIENTAREDLVKLINGHAWYLVQRDKPAKEIMALVKRAQDHIDTRIDGALEQWIARQKPEDQQKPFLTTREGESYSLLDILHSIRTGEDEIGQEMAKNITSLAISMLARDRSRIGN